MSSCTFWCKFIDLVDFFGCYCLTLVIVIGVKFMVLLKIYSVDSVYKQYIHTYVFLNPDQSVIPD